MHIFRDIPQKMISKWQIRYIYHKITWLCRPLWCRACHQDASNTGGVCPGIAKHHGRYSKSDHLCQDGEEWTSRRKRLRRRIFVKYAVEISDLPLFSSRDVCKNKGYRIIGGKQCHSVNKCKSKNCCFVLCFSHESTKGKTWGSQEKRISSSD